MLVAFIVNACGSLDHLYFKSSDLFGGFPVSIYCACFKYLHKDIEDPPHNFFLGLPDVPDTWHVAGISEVVTHGCILHKENKFNLGNFNDLRLFHTSTYLKCVAVSFETNSQVRESIWWDIERFEDFFGRVSIRRL